MTAGCETGSPVKNMAWLVLSASSKMVFGTRPARMVISDSSPLMDHRLLCNTVSRSSSAAWLGRVERASSGEDASSSSRTCGTALANSPRRNVRAPRSAPSPRRLRAGLRPRLVASKPTPGKSISCLPLRRYFGDRQESNSRALNPNTVQLRKSRIMGMVQKRLFRVTLRISARTLIGPAGGFAGRVALQANCSGQATAQARQLLRPGTIIATHCPTEGNGRWLGFRPGKRTRFRSQTAVPAPGGAASRVLENSQEKPQEKSKPEGKRPELVFKKGAQGVARGQHELGERMPLLRSLKARLFVCYIPGRSCVTTGSD